MGYFSATNRICDSRPEKNSRISWIFLAKNNVPSREKSTFRSIFRPNLTFGQIWPKYLPSEIKNDQEIDQIPQTHGLTKSSRQLVLEPGFWSKPAKMANLASFADFGQIWTCSDLAKNASKMTLKRPKVG